MKSIIELNNNNFWKDRRSPNKSLKKAAKLFNKNGGKVIIEIGTGIQGEKSGNSVLVWAKMTKAKNIFCLDVDDVRNATLKFDNVKAIKVNGLDFIQEYEGFIDLLYLDFWVEDKPEDVQGTARAENYLKAFELAKEKMSKNSIILIDDTDHIDPWKQTYIVPAARKYGYNVLWCGRQTCLFKEN